MILSHNIIVALADFQSWALWVQKTVPFYRERRIYHCHTAPGLFGLFLEEEWGVERKIPSGTSFHLSLSIFIFLSLCFFPILFIYYKEISFPSSPSSIRPLFFWDMSHITRVSVSPTALQGFLIGWGSGARPVWCWLVGGWFWPEGPRQAELTSLNSRCQDGVVEGKMRSRLLCATLRSLLSRGNNHKHAIDASIPSWNVISFHNEIFLQIFSSQN